MKKRLLYFFSALGIIFLAFILFAPESRIYTAKSMWWRLIGDRGQLCFDHWTNTLKNPESARYITYHILSNGRLYAEYRAQNSFGTYIKGTFDCPLKADGELDVIEILGEKTERLRKQFNL